MKKLGYLLTGVVLGATLFGGAQAAVDAASRVCWTR